jgi:hypothetical protein
MGIPQMLARGRVGHRFDDCRSFFTPRKDIIEVRGRSVLANQTSGKDSVGLSAALERTARRGAGWLTVQEDGQAIHEDVRHPLGLTTAVGVG